MEALTNKGIMAKRFRQRAPPEERIMRDDEMEMKSAKTFLYSQP